METPVEQVVYRVRKRHRRDDVPKGYQHTFEVLDQHGGHVVATCDVVGRPAFATHRILDERGRPWQMKPNRKVMPSRWIVTDPDERPVMQFDQKILGSLVNPLYRCALAILDGGGRELYRLIDPRTNVPDRIFGTGPGNWAFVDGDRLVGKLVRLRRQEETESKGLLGRLRALVATTDPGIVSIGTDHLLPAPAALGMIIIFTVITDVS